MALDIDFLHRPLLKVATAIGSSIAMHGNYRQLQQSMFSVLDCRNTPQSIATGGFYRRKAMEYKMASPFVEIEDD
jgi:hypothetical protein